MGYNWQTHYNFLALPRYSFLQCEGFKIPQLQILLWFTCKIYLIIHETRGSAMCWEKSRVMWEAGGEIGSSVFQPLAKTLGCCKHVCAAAPKGFGRDHSAQRTLYESKVIDLQNPLNHTVKDWIWSHTNCRLRFYRVFSETITLCRCYSSVFIFYWHF